MGDELNKDKARQLRKNPTEAEQALWRHLRLRQMGGHKFRRQQPLGLYIVDFVCLERRLIIELDGGHHSSQEVGDSERSVWLESQGFCVLRFWNNDVMREIDAVKTIILQTLESVPEIIPSTPRGNG